VRRASITEAISIVVAVVVALDVAVGFNYCNKVHNFLSD
jgi:hypothetical protein